MAQQPAQQDSTVADLVTASLARHAAGTDPGAVDLLARARRWGPDLVAGLSVPYPNGAHPDVLDDVIDRLVTGWIERPQRLRERDRDRALCPDWFQRPDCIGYVAYADRFAGTLPGVAARIDYLRELSVSYVHLMPLLQPRPGADDGGYAVADYRSVRTDLGTMADLERLTESLHDAGISLTLDLVLNHVAREHVWAQQARAGDAVKLAYFRTFPDRTEPDAYEQSLPEVFPDFAPGSFSWDDDLDAWVWTTFNTWQWDLNWANPAVFAEFVDLVLFLANRGVDCLRLDAIAFVWKRLGTTCQNEPEVHAITQALRAVAHIAAPSVVFKAEAIVGRDQLAPYLGVGAYAGRVSDLAYHNSLMVQIWSALATRDGRLLAQALHRFPPKPTTTAWATYLRCHDDIGWAIDDDDAGVMGWSGPGHRGFLAEFYAGTFQGSFGRGADFQANPSTGDRRTSGSAASLAGLEAALELGSTDVAELGSAEAVELALARLFCAHAMVYGFGGIPLLYMGDELALLNDDSYLDDPALAGDNRWMHRPAMPWDIADQRDDRTSVPGRLHAGLALLGRVRRELPALHAAVETFVRTTDNNAAICFVRSHAAGTVVQVYNVSDTWQTCAAEAVAPLNVGEVLDQLGSGRPRMVDGRILLAPYAACWFARG